MSNSCVGPTIVIYEALKNTKKNLSFEVGRRMSGQKLRGGCAQEVDFIFFFLVLYNF